VPGLYAAGGIAGHYLGGVGPVSYDGKIAGIDAARSAAALDRLKPPDQAVAQEESRVLGHLQDGPDGPRPIEIKVRVREIMWQLGYVKNEKKLQTALAALQSLREEQLPRLRLQSTSRVWNTGWMDALDVSCMIDACEATVRSGLLRKESRGPFYRDDFPVVDNENWLCKVIVNRTNGQWGSRTEPYSLPYLTPEKGREPFFEVDY
jgi:succinate dehydrogenase/fumarate reductase flavoprotein subunit